MNNSALARNLALNVVLAALFVDDLYAEVPAVELIGSTVDVSSGHAGRLSPFVVYNSADNEYVVVWSDSRAIATTGSDIFGQRLSADGKLLGENIPIAQEIGSQGASFAAYNSTDNNYLVGWLSQFDGPGSRDFNDAFGRLLSNEGVPLGSEFRISDAGLEMSTAYNSRQNNYLVTGRVFNSGPVRGIFGRIVSSGGFVVGEEIAISTAGDPAPAGQVVYNPNVNEYFATWRDQEERNVKGQRISSTGDLIGNPIIVSPSFPISVTPNNSVVAFDRANDRYLVVFSAFQEGDIWGQFVSSSGVLIGSNFLIGRVSSPIQPPSVAHSSIHNVFFVVWLAANDVFGQLLSETGETKEAHS